MNTHEISATSKLMNQMYTSDSENLIKKLGWVMNFLNNSKRRKLQEICNPP